MKLKSFRNPKFIVLFFACVVLLSGIQVGAQAAPTLNFQSKIVNKTTGMNVTTGSPACVLAGADTCDFQVDIYSESSGGTLLFSERHVNVEIGDVEGLISLDVNSVCNNWSSPVASGNCLGGSGIDWGNDSTIYLELGFSPAGNNTITETFNRKQIQSTPFSFFADDAASLEGRGADGFIHLGPSTSQTYSDSIAAIRVNETGAGSPNFIRFLVDGATKFVVDNAGRIGINVTPTNSFLDLPGATAGDSSLKVRPGVMPTSPTNGDIYNDGTNLYYYNGTSWVSLSGSSGGSSAVYSAEGVVADGDFLEILHSEGSTDVVASSWKVDAGTGSREAITSRTGFYANFGDADDGNLTTSGNFNINSNTSGGRSYADGIAYRVDASSASGTSINRFDANSNFANGFAAGDEALLINLQGAPGDVADVGNYEFLQVTGVTASTLTFATSIQNSYDGTTAANQKVLIQRVPNYRNVTVSAGHNFTTGDWDALATLPTGSAGYQTGVLAFRVAAQLTIQTGAEVHADQKGFSGAIDADHAEAIDGKLARGGIPGTNGQNGAFGDQGGAGGNGGVIGGGKGGQSPSTPCMGGSGGGGGGGRPHTVPANLSSTTRLYLGAGATQGAWGGGAGGSAGGSLCLGQKADGGWGGGMKRNTGAAGDGGGILYMSAARVANSGSISTDGSFGTSGTNGGNSIQNTSGNPSSGGGGGGGRGGQGAAGGSAYIRSFDNVAASAAVGPGGSGGAGGIAYTGSLGLFQRGENGAPGGSQGSGPPGYMDKAVIPVVSDEENFAVVIVDENRVRLYNFTGTSQNLQLNISVDSGGADVAENYLSYDKTIRSGDLVAIDTENDMSVVEATTDNINGYYGVVSTQPGVLIGGEYGQGMEQATMASQRAFELNKKLVQADEAIIVPVALEGRVPVRVSLENGPIRAGDQLTISMNEPGTAAKGGLK